MNNVFPTMVSRKASHIPNAEVVELQDHSSNATPGLQPCRLDNEKKKKDNLLWYRMTKMRNILTLHLTPFCH